MKGEERGKPQISIPQKSAVAIVPPKKVRTLRFWP
jgi:bud emergence protein 1